VLGGTIAIHGRMGGRRGARSCPPMAQRPSPRTWGGATLVPADQGRS
jgi:hypothetical protein